jgi:hypothetical protein
LNKGVRNNSVSSTTIDITILDAAVLQPAMQFTADRAKPPMMKSVFVRKNVDYPRRSSFF